MRPTLRRERQAKESRVWPGAPARAGRVGWLAVWEPEDDPKGCVGPHPAAFPRELARRCILLGSRDGDTVLDPFGGSGTTGAVASELGRKSILIELNPKYAQMSQERDKHGKKARV